MRDERVKVVLVEAWNDRKLAERVAQDAGARAVLMAGAVGGVKGADTYIAAVDYNVRVLAEALRQGVSRSRSDFSATNGTNLTKEVR